MAGPGFHFLACGCNHCREELTTRFSRIVHSSFDLAEEKNLDLLAERLDIHYNDQSIAERIAAYGEREAQR